MPADHTPQPAPDPHTTPGSAPACDMDQVPHVPSAGSITPSTALPVVEGRPPLTCRKQAGSRLSGVPKCCAPCSSPRSSVWVFLQVRGLMAPLRAVQVAAMTGDLDRSLAPAWDVRCVLDGSTAAWVLTSPAPVSFSSTVPAPWASASASSSLPTERPKPRPVPPRDLLRHDHSRPRAGWPGPVGQPVAAPPGACAGRR